MKFLQLTEQYILTPLVCLSGRRINSKLELLTYLLIVFVCLGCGPVHAAFGMSWLGLGGTILMCYVHTDFVPEPPDDLKKRAISCETKLTLEWA